MRFLAAFDIGRLSLAIGGGRQFEDAQDVRQFCLGLFDGGLLVVRRCDVLEADDVHAGRDKFHLDLLAFDGDIQRTLAVNVRAELPVLRLLPRGPGRQE